MQTRMLFPKWSRSGLAGPPWPSKGISSAPRISNGLRSAGPAGDPQSRPLNVRSHIAPVVCDIASVTDQYPVLFADKGIIVQNGIATGKVFIVQRDGDLERFPNGAILVSRETSPRFAKVARKAAGIITDVGASTGHMATIAREFRIPTVVNTEVATQILKPGQEITLDAQANVVYAGRIKELCYYS